MNITKSQNPTTKIKLLAIRVVEVIYNEETGKCKAGKFLHKEKTDLKITMHELEYIKSELSKKYNVATHFIHCDFEIIEN